MNTKTKSITLALMLAAVAGTSFVAAQSITGTTVPTAGPPEGTGRGGMRGGMRGGQPRMDMALLSLQEARRMLDGAVHDKGGNREKAIASVDKAIEDVKAGIEYARQHPEEFGHRGARGEPPTGTSAAPEGTSSST